MPSNHHIYLLRHSQLDERLALMLSPFISSYRPHDPIPSLEELQEERVNQTHLSLKDIIHDLSQF